MPSPSAYLSHAVKPTAIIAAALLSLTASARANDASVDLAFATHETPSAGNDVSGVRAVLVQPDGKIVIGGDFSDNFFASGISGRQNNLARLKPDGHYDPAFALTSVNTRVGALAIQPDGKLLVGGYFSQVGSLARDAVARLNADGTPDASFGPAGSYTRPGSNIDVEAIAVQPDGKILVGGAFRVTLSDGTVRDNIMRLNANGTADPGFIEDLDAHVALVSAIAVQPDGKVLVGSTGGALLVRLNADGSKDAGFTAPIYNGSAFGNRNHTVHSIALQPDGKIVAGGLFVTISGSNENRASLARFNTEGSVDTSFNTGFNSYTTVYSLALQADGKVVAGGTLYTLDGVPNHTVERFNADGSLDAGFDEGDGARDDGEQLARIFAVAIQADGKALIGGNLVSYGGQARAGVARLGGNGTTSPPTDLMAPDLSGGLDGVKAKINAKGTKTVLTGTLTVRNGGTKPAKNVVVDAYLSDDQSFSATADHLIGTLALADAGFPKVGKNGKQVVLPVKFKASLSETGSASGKYLVLVLDPDNTIMETDETNNVVVSGPLP